MRWPLTGLALVLALLLSGTGTEAQEAPPTSSRRDVTVSQRRTSTDEPSARPTRRSPSPVTPESGRSSDAEVLHPPMPVPVLPVPDGYRVSAPLAAAVPRAPEAPVALVASPALAAGFAGLGDEICSAAAGGCTIPPDTHGAAGPAHLMEVLNTQVWVQDPASGAILSGPVPLNDTSSANAFWPPAVNPDGAGAFDPRVVYDPYADRWFTVACDDSRSATSALLVGVSKGGVPDVVDPGQWDFLRIDVDGTGEVWADYPSVGFNAKWVVVQVNMYNVSDNVFRRSHIYVFDKTDLYAGTIAPMRISLAGHGGTQVPAATYDPAEPDLHLVQRWNGNSGGVGYLRVYWLTGPANAPVLEGVDPVPYFLASPDPWDTHAPPPPPLPPDNFGPQIQPGADPYNGCFNCADGTCLIQTNDDRIQNVVQRHDTLWAAHTVFLPAGGAPTRSSLQWWEIVPPTAGLAVRQRGRVDDDDGLAPDFFYAFPTIAVNAHGDALLGYSSFEGNDYARASYSFRFAYDLPGDMRDPASLKTGEACYFKDFNSGRNRWGDYSATVADPDGTRLWTLQEYAALPDIFEPDTRFRDKWGTWWGVLDATRTLSIDDVSVAEGDSGTTAFTFTITLSEPTLQTVTVEWSTADGTAFTADTDYAGVGTTLVTFNPGEKSKPVTVLVNGDIVHEPDETFFVNLANPTPTTGVTLADGQGQGTILNDDPEPQISIGDVTMVEGNSGTTDFVFPVTLSHPSSTSVTASWVTNDGSATVAGSDYTANSGGVTFVAGDVLETVTVSVIGDLAVEPNEDFFVVLSSPSGGTLLKAQAVGTILDDDATTPGVLDLVVISDGGSTAASGRDRLEWLNPAGGSANYIRIKWTESSTPCVPVTYPTDPTTVTPETQDVAFGSPGSPQMWEHANLNLNQYYCYSVWIYHSAAPGAYSSVETIEGRPYDATGKVKWKYITGQTTMPPPTVGLDGVLAPSNDFWVHAMERDPTGGTGGAWPASWSPVNLGSPAQQRSPIVPLGGVNRAYFTSQDGRVHCVNAKTGALLWSAQLTPGAGQAAPAGIFSAWGGVGDYVLVGTSSGSGNFFYALDPFTGAVIDRFPGPGDGAIDLGPVFSSASVDYSTGRVYFASRGTVGSPETLWCLKLGPSSDALSLLWKKKDEGATPLGDITGSPVLRGSRVYVGNDAGVAWAVDAANGTPAYFYDTADPAPVDFIFPDRSSQLLYLSTANSVWGLEDMGTSLDPKWEVPLPGSNPSTVLYWPGQNRLYVGLEDAPSIFFYAVLMEVQTDLPDPNLDLRFEELEGYAVGIGPPSLDTGHNLLHVGSEAGILYAVEAPFKPF